MKPRRMPSTVCFSRLAIRFRTTGTGNNQTQESLVQGLEREAHHEWDFSDTASLTPGAE
jgi:hypothetical protein